MATSVLGIPGHQAADIRGGFQKSMRRGRHQKFRFHDRRHNCDAWLVQAGIPLATIRNLLGHSAVLMTERYAGWALDNLRMVVDALDESHSGHGEQEDLQHDALHIS
jgi:integrase